MFQNRKTKYTINFSSSSDVDLWNIIIDNKKKFYQFKQQFNFPWNKHFYKHFMFNSKM